MRVLWPRWLDFCAWSDRWYFHATTFKHTPPHARTAVFQIRLYDKRLDRVRYQWTVRRWF